MGGYRWPSRLVSVSKKGSALESPSRGPGKRPQPRPLPPESRATGKFTGRSSDVEELEYLLSGPVDPASAPRCHLEFTEWLFGGIISFFVHVTRNCVRSVEIDLLL